MPDTQTVTETQLREIEARPSVQAAWSQRIELRVEERDALCRSLRAAREQLAGHEEINKQLMKDLGRATDECRKLQDENAALRTQNQTQAESIIYFQENEKSLKAQLVETRAESERLASQLKDWQDEKDAKAGYL